MIPVAEALDKLFALVEPLGSETVGLREARGRVLARPVHAALDQPPFPASAMDGYAIAGPPRPGAEFRVIGTAAAGAGFDGNVGAGEAVRIFTGAPVPESADHVLIQEDTRQNSSVITVTDAPDQGPYIRPAGNDFAKGARFAPAGPLRPVDIALLAAMGHGSIPVTRRPVIALIATGDELVSPGETPSRDQIVASNGVGLASMIEAAGGKARLLPIARDTPASLGAAFDLTAGADLIVTIGGASVGDHDLVAGITAERGMTPAFHKVAMRPGKPLMAGRLGGVPMIGLPGNPVSSMVCGVVFILPILRKMLGRGAAPAPRATAPLATALPANGPREHYMRATLREGRLSVAARQDSALLSVLADAGALVVRPAHDAERAVGARVEYIDLS